MTPDKQPLAARLEKYATLVPEMADDLRAAAKVLRERGWRPIAEAMKQTLRLEGE